MLGQVVSAALADATPLRIDGPGAPVAPDAPCAVVHPDAPAWIAFTSGSTGEPKGIVGSHRPLSHFLDWHQRTFGLGEADRFSLLSGLAHDPLLRDVFTPLWAGGELRVPAPERMAEPGWLAGWLAREAVTVAHLTPAMARLLTTGKATDEADPLAGLRLICSGGDALTGDDVARLRQAAPRALLVNVYGATETPQVMGWKVVEEAASRIPLGRGIDGVDLLVLGRSGRPAGVGELGEICIRTPYLALGYRDDPAGTAERFAPDPGAGSGGRLYRTGDLGRYEPDGEVTYAGRADRQVKIRGFRIEPGEIEAAIGGLPGVRQAAVVMREERYLAAYIVPEPGEAPGLAGRLRPLLVSRLPEFMVPAAFVELPALPLTPNGKLDRRALPSPERPDLEPGAAPRNPVESRLAELWAELLPLDRIGVRDNFFELGGHSLLATQLVSRVRAAFGVELSLRQLFENPTLERLASVISSQGAGGGEVIPRRPPGLDPVPASFAQERMWLLDRLQPGNPAYNIPYALRLLGELPALLMEAALGEVVRRHESLRTTFRDQGGHPVQVIAPAGHWMLPRVDLSTLPEDRRLGELRRLAQDEAALPFDLGRGPLLRSVLVRVGTADHGLLVTLHHAISDGWSVGVMIREITVLFAAALAGRPSPLAPLAIQYADFAVWQREWLAGGELERQLAYWRRRLDGAPASLDLPTDRPRPPAPTYRGARALADLDPELAGGLARFAFRHQATLFMVILAAFQTLLRRLTRQEDIPVGSPIANRNRAEIEPLIGFFVNTLVLRGDLAGDPPFRELVARLRDTTLEAYAHQDLPFELLVEALRPQRHLAVNPLFQVMCAVQNTPREGVDLPGLSLAPLDLELATARFDFELNVWETGDSLALLLIYSTELFDETTVLRLAGSLETLLRGALADDGRRLAELPLLPEAARHQLVVEWNDTARAGEPAGVLDRFAAQVAATPDALALEAGDERLTYTELERRANRLAHRLRRSGVGPEVAVGLFAERSADLVAGLLAVWKAGGAYVPLDPGHPRARLAYLLEDSQVAVILAGGGTLEVLPPGAAPVVRLDAEDLAAESDLAPPGRPRPGDLAYRIYTSGTTGLPKAVQVEHGNLASTLAAVQAAFGFGPLDRMPCIASSSFDIFLFELLGPLLAGGACVLLPLRPTLDLERLVDELGAATLLHAVPAVMRQVLETARRRGAGAPRLRALFTGGDAVPADLLADLREAFPQAAVHELYGPTEAAIVCSFWPVPAHGPVTRSLLGRPFAGAEIHLRDEAGQPVPIGMPGEIWIGGAGVTRGYWRREELTREKFVEAEGGRFFRSGDVARSLPDGDLEFLGRADQQVKVRGFRIELGEVEGALLRQPGVEEAVAVARETAPGAGRQLVAYVVAGAAATTAALEDAAEHVDQWQTLYDETYGRSAATDPTFDVEGWNSSYTGEPIPAGEMREWVDGTVERILSLLPPDGGRRVLEVGCGTGLVLFRAAPHSGLYRGTDFSQVALDGLRRRIGQAGLDLPQVELARAAADDWSSVAPGSFDLVILNSVVQYFPDVRYLLRVLEGAARAVRPGGAVWIGDVRNLDLLEALHASVELFRATGPESVAELRRRVRRKVVDEEELLIAPAFFPALAAALPEVSRATLLPKPGRHLNELTRFRFDAILHVGDTGDTGELKEGVSVLVDLEQRAKGDLAALALLASAEDDETVEELWRAIAAQEAPAIDPAVVHAAPAPPLPWSAYVNEPLRGKVARRLVPELRRALQAELPDYMVPSAIVVLDALPLNPNGKVDRAALPEPAPARSAAGSAPPRTPIEQALATLWREVLGLEEIGREDGFFELGGHSLLATQLVSRVREAFRVELPLRVIFETPTIAGLAAWIERARLGSGGEAVAPPLRHVPRDRPLPLSFSQERLWFLDRLRPGDPSYNMPTALRALGDLSPALLEAVLGEVVRRHEALRTTFQLRDGQPAQVIAPPGQWSLPRVDLSGLPEGAAQAEARRLAQEEAVRPFDLERGPLLRAALLRLGPAEHALLLAMHHIVSDGWSMGVFVREITTLYGAALAGRPSPLPELPVQYADFTVWQRGWLTGAELERQLGYWRQRLAGAPASLDLPTDRPRPAVPSHHGGRVVALWEPDFARELARCALRHDITPFMLLLAAFQALLGRLTGQEDIPVGSPIANRNRAEIEPLIGFFVNNLVLRGDLAGDPPFRELLDRTRRTTLEAYAHQDLPFEQVVEALKPQRTLAVNPLFQVMFAVQNAPETAVELPGLSFSPLSFEKDTARFDLELGVWGAGESLLLELVYGAELFDAMTLQRLTIALETLLRGALSGDGRRLSDLPLLPEAARHQIVAEWNDTRPAGEPRGVVERFAAQVAATPDAIALETAGERLTYAELDRRSNRLAHRLRRLGVGPEVAVGLFVERTAEMVAGMLGVWKAGGAYLPLDPGSPTERLAYLLEDSAVPLIAVGAGLAAALPPRESLVVRLDDADLAEESELPPAGLPAPGDLAYLIYTSGTTGRPKAVLVEHGNLASTLAAAQEDFGFRPGDRTASLGALTFDVSLLELLAPLLSGGTCALLPLRPTLDLERVVEEMGSASFLHMVPAVMRQVLALARHRGASAPRLRTLFLGGDAVPADLLTDLRETFPRTEIWVLYGPTETAIVCTRWRLPATGPVRSLLGRPFAGTEIHLRDAGGRPVPIGVAGEIWIGGAGVARGYWRREELTAEKFVTVEGRRFFRSGDLARSLPDGTLEFLGRSDSQVKVRGFRIELGEIEAALTDQPGVREAVVLARDDGRGGERRLVAYVVAEPRVSLEAAALRAALAGRLTAYMLPAAFVFLEALPLNANGKIDRGALPAPEAAGVAETRPSVPPRDALERLLADQFREVLGFPAEREIGIDHDFFDLGGTSITGAILVYRLQESLGRKVQVVAIFDHPTVASLAGHLRERPAGAVPGVLVRLQEGSPDRRPLFCVHPVGGEVVAYRELARHLGADQPVYGLQSSDPPLEDVREMAALYVAAVREVQPAGPYRIAGWSMGGVVAYEMARELEEQGEKVETLALIDAASPARWAGEPEPSGAELVALFAADLARLHGLALPDVDLSSLGADGALAHFLDLGRRAGLLPPGLQLAELRRLFDRFRANRRALTTYGPQPGSPAYGGKVDLFRAAGRVARMEDKDPTLGWGELLDGALRVSDLPGDHYSILREEVESLAGPLRALLS